MKIVGKIIFSLCLIFSLAFGSFATTQPIVKPSVVDDIRCEFMLYTFESGLSYYEKIQKREELSNYLDFLEYLKEYNKNDVADAAIQEEINNTKEIVELYHLGKWESRFQSFPVATTAWIYLKYELGYSDVICASIMGNMMQETGGGSLNLRWDLYSASGSGCYGLLQWHPRYFDLPTNANLYAQLDFMGPSIQYIMDKEGPHRDNTNFSQFISMQSIREATRAFYIVYENPQNNTYEQRVQNAWEAYYYFSDTR